MTTNGYLLFLDMLLQRDKAEALTADGILPSLDVAVVAGELSAGIPSAVELLHRFSTFFLTASERMEAPFYKHAEKHHQKQ